jgi:cytochrome c6
MSTQIKLAACIASLAVCVSCRPAWGADTTNGAKLYVTYCASCHGRKGEGVMPGTPDFRRGIALMQPDSKLLARVQRGKNAMPGYLGILKERDILDVIAHLRTLN